MGGEEDEGENEDKEGEEDEGNEDEDEEEGKEEDMFVHRSIMEQQAHATDLDSTTLGKGQPGRLPLQTCCQCDECDGCSMPMTSRMLAAKKKKAAKKTKKKKKAKKTPEEKAALKAKKKAAKAALKEKKKAEKEALRKKEKAKSKKKKFSVRRRRSTLQTALQAEIKAMEDYEKAKAAKWASCCAKCGKALNQVSPRVISIPAVMLAGLFVGGAATFATLRFRRRASTEGYSRLVAS